MRRNEKEVEKILKALSNERRLKILRYLKTEKEATVGDIAGTITLSLKATSKHLRVLSSADIVERDQRSTLVYYALVTPAHPIVSNVISILKTL